MWPPAAKTIDVELLGLRIGDFVLVTFPGELTVQIGLNIKKASPHELTFVAGYTNGYIYYAPTGRAASECGRRAGGQRLPAGAGMAEAVRDKGRGNAEEAMTAGTVLPRLQPAGPHVDSQRGNWPASVMKVRREDAEMGLLGLDRRASLPRHG